MAKPNKSTFTAHDMLYIHDPEVYQRACEYFEAIENSAKPSFRVCSACTMIKAGVKTRKRLKHTCGK